MKEAGARTCLIVLASRLLLSSTLYKVLNIKDTCDKNKKLRFASYFFNSLLGVSSGDETLRLMLDILHQKEKLLRWAINSSFFLSKTGVAVHRTSRESSREFAATSLIRIIV